ncbi:MAG: preprotein translocase subunit YajC [Clostridiales Family XIII bacterium]|jgi:preprotein translocase subunit YajC|nr:preprotein translocase subunit YajC [Clostridiales Family XIII bacterium]
MQAIINIAPPVVASGTQSMLIQLAPLILIFGIFYLIFIVPQRRKDKQRKEMRAAIATGDKIITIGGIRGRVIRVYENSVIISVGKDNTKIEVMKWAIGDKDGGVVERKTAAESKDSEEPAKKPRKLGVFGKAKPEPEEEVQAESYDELDESIEEIEGEVAKAEAAETNKV